MSKDEANSSQSEHTKALLTLGGIAVQIKLVEECRISPFDALVRIMELADAWDSRE